MYSVQYTTTHTALVLYANRFTQFDSCFVKLNEAISAVGRVFDEATLDQTEARSLLFGSSLPGSKAPLDRSLRTNQFEV